MKTTPIKQLPSSSSGLYEFLDHFLGRKNVYALFGNARKKMIKDFQEKLESSGTGLVFPVERRKNIDPEELQNEFIKRGIPVVLEGAAAKWNCCKKWSMEYFKDLHGTDEIVMVDQSKIENPFDKLTLKEVIESIGTEAEKYYRFYPLLVRHPEHIADFDYSWLRSQRQKTSFAEAFQVFIGGAESETPIHNASAANLFVQVCGEKKWVIYPPSYSTVIEPQPVRNLYRSAPYKSEQPFNPFNPDYSTYPLYEYADAYEAYLKPGDILYNPPYYWHAVKNLTNSIGVGYRWIAPFYCFQINPLYSFLDLFVTKPPIWKSLKLFKKDFNLVQLAETGRLKEYQRQQESR